MHMLMLGTLPSAVGRALGFKPNLSQQPSNPLHSSGTFLLHPSIQHLQLRDYTVMPPFPPSKIQQHREHLVGNNLCVDRSPDLRFCAVTGDGQPITPDPARPSAQTHFHIAITNQPGGLIDVYKIPSVVSASQHNNPGPLPPLALRKLPLTRLGHNDLRRTLANKRARTLPLSGQQALEPRIPPALW
jgi:hypothetical protein